MLIDANLIRIRARYNPAKPRFRSQALIAHYNTAVTRKHAVLNVLQFLISYDRRIKRCSSAESHRLSIWRHFEDLPKFLVHSHNALVVNANEVAFGRAGI